MCTHVLMRSSEAIFFFEAQRKRWRNGHNRGIVVIHYVCATEVRVTILSGLSRGVIYVAQDSVRGHDDGIL